MVSEFIKERFRYEFYRNHVRYIRDTGDQRNVEKVFSEARNHRRPEIVVVETQSSGWRNG